MTCSVTDLTDPLDLACGLIACPSITPDDGGAQNLLARTLESLGFRVQPMRFGAIHNLFASIGEGERHFCFAGHTDVVPPGPGWRFGPFNPVVEDGVLYGRGAVDMKGAIAAFVAAVAAYRTRGGAGRISLLITGDEEGEAIDGTKRVLEEINRAGERIDFCLVGEPTSIAQLCDVIKIGRRGSLSAAIDIPGVQGHVAYPHLADNPVHRLLAALQEMLARPLDSGSDWFQPSSLQVTSIDVGNPAGNVIPGHAGARLNIRFNDHHRGADLQDWLAETLRRHAPGGRCQVRISGESFLTAPGPETTMMQSAIAAITGVSPRLDTGGGTSDARFIANYCKVAEFGLCGTTMHKTDEAVAVAQLRDLARIYEAILVGYFQ